MTTDSIFENGNDGVEKGTGIGDLLGKKSVRATFKLHPTSIELLGLIASQLGLKQKSLFDYLMEDEKALRAMADSASPGTVKTEQRIQKTFVVSQRSLDALKNVTKDSAASREDLIERSIRRLLPVLEKEQQRQRRRAEAFVLIDRHYKQGDALVEQVKETVGEEDALYQFLATVMSAYAKAYDETKNLVDKGERMSQFPIDALKRDQTKR
jgi:hypothetical protein